MTIDNIHIRKCRPGDQFALTLVSQATFLETFGGVLSGKGIVEHCSKAYSPKIYGEWIDDPNYHLWLVEVSPGGAPVGYMVLTPPDIPVADTDGDVELKRVYLLSKFHGAGTGKQLMDIALAHTISVHAKRLLLAVYENNDKAINFYERAGFHKLGKREVNIGGSKYYDQIMETMLNT